MTQDRPDEGPRRRSGATLELRPFRGLRFDPSVAGDLGTVVSPPYDVLDADIVHDLESANRHNVVRLILSRRYEAPYEVVAERLQGWREAGVLRADPVPALYAYEYTVDGVTVTGLIGLLGLREEREGVVLPHEDVMPAPVADRVVLMRTTRTNLEPILLVHEGTQGTRAVVRAATSGEPLVEFRTRDDGTHRLWALTGRDELETLASELAPGQALIADGHHRYAAYLRLRAAALRGELPQPDGWGLGLAMLVDQTGSSLDIKPIHRTVDALTLADVRDLCERLGHEYRACAGRAAALRQRDMHGDPAHISLVVSDGRDWALVTAPRTAPVDAAVLSEELFPKWRVTDAQVGYHHSIDQALHRVSRRAGVVVLVRAPSLREVKEAATRGVRMPRKSTSFAPKPLMGLVMRDLRDG